MRDYTFVKVLIDDTTIFLPKRELWTTEPDNEVELLDLLDVYDIRHYFINHISGEANKHLLYNLERIFECSCNPDGTPKHSFSNKKCKLSLYIDYISFRVFTSKQDRQITIDPSKMTDVRLDFVNNKAKDDMVVRSGKLIIPVKRYVDKYVEPTPLTLRKFLLFMEKVVKLGELHNIDFLDRTNGVVVTNELTPKEFKDVLEVKVITHLGKLQRFEND